MKIKGHSSEKLDKILALGAAGLILICLTLFLVYHQGTKRQQKEAQEPVTVTLVYAYQNAQWNQGIQTIVEEFSKAHEEIVIDVQVQYEDKVYEDILSKLQARGQMGDIIQLKTPERYAREGLLAPVPGELGALLDEPYVYEGQEFGLLAIGNTNGILYNRDIFEKYGLSEPEDYDGFLEICEILLQNGITPVGVAGGDLWHLEFWVNHFFRTDVLSQEQNWLKERSAGKVSWQDQAPVRMLTHLKQLFQGEYVNSDWARKQDGSLTYDMSQGDVAMIYTGSWNVREVQKLNPQMSLGWFYVPDETGEVVVSENRDAYWCLTKACGEDERRYQAATAFLDFFYTSDAYTRLCEATCGFPVTVEKRMIPKEELQLKIQEAVFEHQNQSCYIGNEDTPQGFEMELLTGIIELGEGNISVEELSARLDVLWEQYQEQEK